jgi:DNA invertase Pin-like site-specific DNA recombinase
MDRKEVPIMIRPEIVERVKKLRQAGQGIRWIARHLQLSRATVRGILRDIAAKIIRVSDAPITSYEKTRHRASLLPSSVRL